MVALASEVPYSVSYGVNSTYILAEWLRRKRVYWWQDTEVPSHIDATGQRLCLTLAHGYLELAFLRISAVHTLFVRQVKLGSTVKGGMSDMVSWSR